MLAVVHEMLNTILIVGEPARMVHATKLGIAQHGLRLWVHSLVVGAFAPIGDAFSVSFDGSWNKGERSQNMGHGVTGAMGTTGVGEVKRKRNSL